MYSRVFRTLVFSTFLFFGLLTVFNVASSSAQNITPQLIGKLVREHHLNEAKRDLNVVIKRHPNAAKAYYMLAQINYMELDYKAAKLNIDKASSIDPSLKFANKKFYQRLKSNINKKLRGIEGTPGSYQHKAKYSIFSYIIAAVFILLILFLILKVFKRKKQGQDYISSNTVMDLNTEISNSVSLLDHASAQLNADIGVTQNEFIVSALRNYAAECSNMKAEISNCKDQDCAMNVKAKIKSLLNEIERYYESNIYNQHGNVYPNQSVQNPQYQQQYRSGSGGMSFLGTLAATAGGAIVGNMLYNDLFNNNSNNGYASSGLDNEGGYDNSNSSDFDNGGNNSWDDSSVGSGSDSTGDFDSSGNDSSFDDGGGW